MSILRVTGGLAFVLFASAMFTPLANVLTNRLGGQDPLAPAQAIVVLGAGIGSDGTLSVSSLRRTMKGLDLHRHGLASLLVFSGPSRGRGPAEADVRAAFARQCGVTSSSILTESTARTTRDEGERIAALLQPRGIRRILLVVDTQGVPRARGVFTKAGFEVIPVPADDVARGGGPEDRLVLMRRVAMELLAYSYYRVAGYL